MKHFTKIVTLILLFSLSLTGPIYATTQAGTLCKQHMCQYNSTYKHIYHTMKKNIANLPITGNASEDFIYTMIPQHKAAILMSQNVLNYTSHPKVKLLATQIMERQNKELVYMTTLLTQLKKNPACPQSIATQYIQTNTEITDALLTAMGTLSPSSTVDEAFVTQMLAHHKASIAMAENITNYTASPDVQSFAKQIIAIQSTELTELESLLKKV